MTFSKRHSQIKFCYNVNGTFLERSSDLVIDLGTKLTSSLDPRPHIDMICCKVQKSLGFIIRNVHSFRNEFSLKLLYCTLVCSILENGSVIWDPHTINGSLQIERVQRRFLRFAGSLIRIPHTQHDYSPVANHLKLASLVDRRRSLNLNFLQNILSGKIDSPTLPYL